MKTILATIILLASTTVQSLDYNNQNTLFLTKHPIGTVFGASQQGMAIAAVNLNVIEARVREEINKSPEIKNLHSFYLRQNNEDGNFRLHMDADFSLTGTTRCRVDLYFSIPMTRFNTINIVQSESVVDCKTGAMIGDIAKLFESTLNSFTKNALVKSIQITKSEDLESFKKADDNWFGFVSTTFTQGKYCTIDSTPHLCIISGPGPLLYTATNGLFLYKNKLLSLSKIYQTRYSAGADGVKPGPVDLPSVKSQRQIFESRALKLNMKPSTSYPNYAFPSGCSLAGPCIDAKDWIDTDMMIFGGLMCFGGEERGCEAVRRSQTPDGRLSRSPDLRDEKLEIFTVKKQSMFSGDQFLGAISYFAKTKDIKNFTAWINYIISSRTSVNNTDDPSTFVYHSCPQLQDDNCVLKGNEWYLLSRLADYLSQTALIPSAEYIDVHGGNPKYNYKIQDWVGDALISPAGYRIHLPAVKVLLMRKMVVANPEVSSTLNEIADILYARQPKNPFFQYLKYGQSAIVQHSLQNQCTESPSSNRRDWAWQRADIYESAKTESMLWDCVFMYDLLLEK